MHAQGIVIYNYIWWYICGFTLVLKLLACHYGCNYQFRKIDLILHFVIYKCSSISLALNCNLAYHFFVLTDILIDFYVKTGKH